VEVKPLGLTSSLAAHCGAGVSPACVKRYLSLRTGTVRGTRIYTLRYDFPDNAPMHVGQTEIASGVAVGESLVVKAEQVQDRGV